MTKHPRRAVLLGAAGAALTAYTDAPGVDPAPRAATSRDKASSSPTVLLAYAGL